MQTRRIGSNRGSARLWLEGAILSNAGWKQGDRFSISFAGHQLITIIRDPDGLRKVAGTSQRPIIDTNTDKILAALECSIGDTVTIQPSQDTILIRPCHT
jgi:hypothetical protein